MALPLLGGALPRFESYTPAGSGGGSTRRAGARRFLRPPLGDLRHRHALGRQQHYLDPTPGHHGPGAAADDPHQPPTLIVIDLSDMHSFCHRTTMAFLH
jgi:hypothetical protein